MLLEMFQQVGIFAKNSTEMKKYLMIVVAALAAIASCDQKEQGPAEDQKSEAQLAYEQLDSKTEIRKECKLGCGFYEKTKLGDKYECVYSLYFGGGSGYSFNIYLPAERVAPKDRKIAPGYYAVDQAHAPGIEGYTKGVLLVRAPEEDGPHYSFLYETADKNVNCYGTLEEEGFPAKMDIGDLPMALGSTSTVKGTYYSAGSAGGYSDFDCLKLEVSYSQMGTRAEATVCLLINEVYTAGNEFPSLVGTYKSDGTSQMFDHSWVWGEDASHISWYNEWNEKLGSDNIAAVAAYSDAAVATVSRSGGKLYLSATPVLNSTVLFTLVGKSPYAVSFNISIKESDIQMI